MYDIQCYEIIMPYSYILVPNRIDVEVKGEEVKKDAH